MQHAHEFIHFDCGSTDFPTTTSVKTQREKSIFILLSFTQFRRSVSVFVHRLHPKIIKIVPFLWLFSFYKWFGSLDYFVSVLVLPSSSFDSDLRSHRLHCDPNPEEMRKLTAQFHRLCSGVYRINDLRSSEWIHSFTTVKWESHIAQTNKQLLR